MFFAEARTTIQIDAPPHAVWHVLQDLPRWGDWNPSVAAFEGPLEEGAKATLHLRVGTSVLTPAVWFTTVRPGDELSWKGGVPLVITAHHGFRLIAVDGGTRVIQFERFAGLLVPIVRLFLWGRLHARYPLVDQGLKQAAEAA